MPNELYDISKVTRVTAVIEKSKLTLTCWAGEEKLAERTVTPRETPHGVSWCGDSGSCADIDMFMGRSDIADLLADLEDTSLDLTRAFRRDDDEDEDLADDEDEL